MVETCSRQRHKFSTSKFLIPYKYGSILSQISALGLFRFDSFSPQGDERKSSFGMNHASQGHGRNYHNFGGSSPVLKNPSPVLLAHLLVPLFLFVVVIRNCHIHKKRILIRCGSHDYSANFHAL